MYAAILHARPWPMMPVVRSSPKKSRGDHGQSGRGCASSGREHARGRWRWEVEGGGGGGWDRVRTGSKELDEAGPEEQPCGQGVHGAHEDECGPGGGVVRCAGGKEEGEANGLSDRRREPVREGHEDRLGRPRNLHAAHPRSVGELEQRNPRPEPEPFERLCNNPGVSDKTPTAAAAPLRTQIHPRIPRDSRGRRAGGSNPIGRCGVGRQAPERCQGKLGHKLAGRETGDLRWKTIAMKRTIKACPRDTLSAMPVQRNARVVSTCERDS